MAGYSQIGYVAASAWLHTQRIQADRLREIEKVKSDPDMRFCFRCDIATLAYICPKCHDYQCLTRDI